jgi:CheY-like chemotaxis protein
MPKILIADDSIAVRKVAERLLTEAGMGVTLAANGSEALAMLAKDRPDLIVSDYHLAQGTKGDQAIDEVRRECDAPPPAIIITSDPDVRLRERMGRRGLAVLEKPVNLAKLRAMIERLQSASR